MIDYSIKIRMKQQQFIPIKAVKLRIVNFHVYSSLSHV